MASVDVDCCFGQLAMARRGGVSLTTFDIDIHFGQLLRDNSGCVQSWLNAAASLNTTPEILVNGSTITKVRESGGVLVRKPI
jgi:hypothetical protein